MLTPYYIYRHIRPDKDEVFYIGKGTNRRNQYQYERAYAKENRNRIWNAIVALCNGAYTVEIFMEFDDPDICVAKEKELIALYGRKDTRSGTLCNMTDGGDGSWGHIVSEKEKARRALVRGDKHPNFGKKLSPETCVKKSQSIMGEKHFLFGKKITDEWRENIRKAKLGERNPMHGKTGQLHHMAIKIIDISTGNTYYGAKEAAHAAGVSVSIMYQYLDGTRPNKTSMVREDCYAPTVS
jgi:hypothetical protein